MTKPTVEGYLGLVTAIAIRLAEALPRSIDIEDLKQSGIIGLIDAVAKFDSATGVSFTTYAKHRIRGAMLDSLREFDWMSRDGRAHNRRIENAIESLRTEQGDEPGSEDVAEALGISIDRYRALDRSRNGRVISIDSGARKEGSSSFESFDVPSQADSPEILAVQAQAKARLRQVAETVLSERYRLVIDLYYGPEDLTLREIGERLGVNESRVSQIHSECMRKLRDALTNQGITKTSLLAA